MTKVVLSVVLSVLALVSHVYALGLQHQTHDTVSTAAGRALSGSLRPQRVTKVGAGEHDLTFKTKWIGSPNKATVRLRTQWEHHRGSEKLTNWVTACYEALFDAEFSKETPYRCDARGKLKVAQTVVEWSDTEGSLVNICWQVENSEKRQACKEYMLKAAVDKAGEIIKGCPHTDIVAQWYDQTVAEPGKSVTPFDQEKIEELVDACPGLEVLLLGAIEGLPVPLSYSVDKTDASNPMAVMSPSMCLCERASDQTFISVYADKLLSVSHQYLTSLTNGKYYALRESYEGIPLSDSLPLLKLMQLVRDMEKFFGSTVGPITSNVDYMVHVWETKRWLERVDANNPDANDANIPDGDAHTTVTPRPDGRINVDFESSRIQSPLDRNPDLSDDELTEWFENGPDKNMLSKMCPATDITAVGGNDRHSYALRDFVKGPRKGVVGAVSCFDEILNLCTKLVDEMLRLGNIASYVKAEVQRQKLEHKTRAFVLSMALTLLGNIVPGGKILSGAMKYIMDPTEPLDEVVRAVSTKVQQWAMIQFRFPRDALKLVKQLALDPSPKTVYELKQELCAIVVTLHAVKSRQQRVQDSDACQTDFEAHYQRIFGNRAKLANSKEFQCDCSFGDIGSIRDTGDYSFSELDGPTTAGYSLFRKLGIN
eukprot:GFYU01002312.1.p1 GENE.GFYU01002312.1~~GFYU01002312.1.p1  ORF type:complete len:653 (+),score=115.86 GFYU01002312.1:69-2027(+)